MSKIGLKRLFKKKDISSIINSLIEGPILIEDIEGEVLFGNKNGEFSQKHTIKTMETVLGWVSGDNKALGISLLLSHLATVELEKKALSRETLEKYREISMLYGITEKLGTNLCQEEVIQLVIEEAKKIIRIDDYAVRLLNEATGVLEIVMSSGDEADSPRHFRPGEGIVGSVLLSGTCEMVNDVLSDPRYLKGVIKERSLIAAPLKLKDKVIGVMTVSCEEPAQYSSEDMKLLSALAAQTAVALQNVRLSFIRETFGRYLSDEVVTKLIENAEGVQLGGDKKHITIMMSDLRGFTTLSERMTPDSVVTILNNYLGAMVGIIQKYNGTILNFIGDAIVVVFGAPFWTLDHATLAVACAVEMQLAMEKVNNWNIERGYPEIEMGIGISTGHVIVGNIGSEKRQQYTCVGRHANLVSRIESYTVGGQIIVSEDTIRAGLVDLAIGKHMEVHPKGIKAPIKIYSINGIEEPYDLYLQNQRLEMTDLIDAIPVQITVIEGKHTGNECYSGRIIRLSPKEAEIETEAEIFPMVNVKLQLFDKNGETIADDIYAKVQEGTQKSSACTVWMTYLSKAARNVFEQAIRGSIAGQEQ